MSVEFVIGSVVIVTLTVAGLDLYRVIDAQSVALRATTTMAEYVSVEPEPRGSFIDDLAAFSHRHQIALPSHVAFVVSAVTRSEVTEMEPDPPAVVRWERKITVGEDPAPPLADSCGRLGGSGADQAALPADFGMEPGEMVVVVEVCVQLLPEALASRGLLPDALYPTLFYQHQILPVRGDTVPQEPS